VLRQQTRERRIETHTGELLRYFQRHRLELWVHGTTRNGVGGTEKATGAASGILPRFVGFEPL
jgi:hypothetical protein